MSNKIDLPTTSESNPDACSSGCPACCSSKGLLRAVAYMPVVMVLGALAALAMFPDLADYGYPLIGNPSHTGFTGEHPCSITSGNSSCSVAPALPGSCSFPSTPSTANSTESGGCCPTSRAGQISTEVKVESNKAAEEASGDVAGGSITSDELPADATSPLNIVDLEVPSN